MLQWQLPDDFTGSITPLTENSDNLTLYDAQSDTIYLYNPYQMAVLHEENLDAEPVMDGDAQAETFGCGQLIYPNGEDNAYLTYSLNHRYVLSKQFSSDISVQPYSVTVKEGKADGRDFPGQVIKELGGKTYILIGNEQQLRKIGVKQSNGEYYPVRGAAYQAYRESAFNSWKLDTDAKGNTSFCTVVMLTYQLQIMESGILHLEQLFRQAKVLADWSTTTTESHAVLTRQQAKLTPT